MIFEILKSSLSVRLGAGGSDFLAKGAASDLAGKNSIFKDPRRLLREAAVPLMAGPIQAGILDMAEPILNFLILLGLNL